MTTQKPGKLLLLLAVFLVSQGAIFASDTICMNQCRAIRVIIAHFDQLEASPLRVWSFDPQPAKNLSYTR